MAAGSRPSIGVIIPAYNAEQTLGRALDSVLCQTRPPDEILLIDDFSSDSTADLARTYVDRGVKVLRLDERRGAAAARNAGIEASRGDWVAFLDADDEWLPRKLEKQAAAIASHPDASLVFCASEEFSACGDSLGDTFRGLPVEIGQNAWKALLGCNFVATPTVLAPRELLLELGGFDETLKVAEDQDMWIRLALSGLLAYVPETLVKVYVQPASLSSWKVGDQTVYTLPMIERHIAALRDQLTPREVRAIRGTRLQNAGLINCAHGDLWEGMSQLLRSALLGCRPFRALRAIIMACVRGWFLKPLRFGQRAARRPKGS
jgi:glycosyltransferase involved in cell wall biosynthesis